MRDAAWRIIEFLQGAVRLLQCLYGGRPFKAIVTLLALLCVCVPAVRAELLVPMDLEQTNHLKAYGLAYQVLEEGANVRWLLNFRGGSFLLPEGADCEREARALGVKVERVDAGAVAHILGLIEEGNMEVILLEKAPRIAIYAPPNKQPWDILRDRL